MAEDLLTRYHIPDASAQVRRLSETGVKADWEDVFNPEESGTDISERITGGGENALDMLLANSESLDPELVFLFSDFLEDVYRVNNLETLMRDYHEELQDLRQTLRKIANPLAGQGEAQQKRFEDRVQRFEFMLDGGLRRQIEKNFFAWMHAEDQLPAYSMENLPKKTQTRIAERETQKQKLALEPDLSKVRAKTDRIDMQAWLNAWTDPEAGLTAVGFKFSDGTLFGCALKSRKYGITGVDLFTLRDALRGRGYLGKNRHNPVVGIDLGKGHLLATGIGRDELTNCVHTLEISGVAHPQLPVVILRD